MRMFRDTHFVLQEKKPTKAFCCTRHLHGVVWNSVCLQYSELLKLLPRDVKRECFGKKLEKAKFFGTSMEGDVDILDDHDYPKIPDTVDPKANEQMWICSSYIFKHKIKFNCAEGKAKMTGNWRIRLWKLYFLYCELFCQFLQN